MADVQVQPGGAGAAGAGGPDVREPLLAVRDLVKEFPVRGSGLLRRTVGKVHAVSGISLDLFEGDTLGLVGESGCGKSTTGRCILRLIEPTSGQVLFRGDDMVTMNRRQLRQVRRNMQIVFQDPYASLNPRMLVSSIVAEPLVIHGMPRSKAKARAGELLELVRLRPEHGNRYPHEFSTGQRQRIGVARALALEPDVLILDEPVSALDVSIRAGVLNLLEHLRDNLRLSYLFISHDLSVVRHICDRVAVMYMGKIVEIGSRADIYGRPAHPYTQALLSAVPLPDPQAERARKRIVLTGDLPSPVDPPSGCRFRTRCWKAQEICAREEPALTDRGQGRSGPLSGSSGHPSACHFAETVEVVP